MKRIISIIILPFLIFMSACAESVPTAENQDRDNTNAIQAQARAAVGMPSVTNFSEKKLATKLTELRDKPDLLTYAYVQGINGKLTCFGKGIGFGIPYSTQITNPMKSLDDKGFEGGDTVLPQAEPNGLYMPENAAATWYMLLDDKGEAHPVYVEPNLTVSTFPLTGPSVEAPCK